MANLDEVKDIKKGRKTDRPKKDFRKEDDMDKSLVCVRRVTKVVKGGRTMRFSALVAVGDKKGKIGIGTGKAGEVPNAIDKATIAAKKSLQTINLVDLTTIPHEVVGKYGTTRILMLPAKEGTGVIAGGAARSIIELAGIKNIVTKIHGSTSKINCVKATLDGLKQLRTPEQVAARRGISVDAL